MKRRPVIVQATAQGVTLTEMLPVPGAAYLQPGASVKLAREVWAALLAKPPLPGETAAVGFTPEQLAAHGLG